MLRSFLYAVLSLLVFSSCTVILSTNVPGKTAKSLPKEWWGKYQAVAESKMPDKRDSAREEKEFVIIEANRITWQHNEDMKSFSLDDSLRYSELSDKSRYLSILMPEGLYFIFKVTTKADTLLLYSLSSADETKVTKGNLNKYFDNVEKISNPGDEYYKVTIVEKKLAAYFKSGIPSAEPTRLVPVR